MIEIILDSVSSLLKAIGVILKSKDLTLGAIIVFISPFVGLWIKISREKDKKKQSKLIERRQMQIAFNVNEILEALKVESKWSLQEIGSTNTVQKKFKQSLLTSCKAILKKKFNYQRRKNMNALKSNLSKKLLALLVGAGVAALNKKYNLQLSDTEIYAILATVLGYIIGQSHVDGKRAIAAATTAVSTAVQASIIPNSPDVSNLSYNDMIPYINSVNTALTQCFQDMKSGRMNDATKDAMALYLKVHSLIEANKTPIDIPSATGIGA
jgi:hypothetical protein